MAMDANRATNGGLHRGEAAPGNTGLSRRNSSGVSLLVAGCDSLYWSGRASIEATYAKFLELRHAAEQGGGAVPWRVIDGHSLSVLPRGVGRYRVVFECFEFTVQLTDSEHIPTAYVELRSDFIHEVGLEDAFSRSLAVAGEIVGQPLGEAQVSRIDLYADYAGWVLTYEDYPGFVTNAKRHTDASDAIEYETFRAGKTPFLVRVYRKDIERRQRGEDRLPTWGEYAGPVTRVEVQASTEFLRKMGVRSFPDVLACRGDIWRYGTRDFLELREVRPGHKEAWPLRTEWQLVQQTGIERFPATGVMPFLVTKGDRMRVLRLLYGCLTSLAAMDGIPDLRAALQRVAVLLTLVPTQRPFAEDVRRKRARLPKAVLAASVDFDAASAGAEKEISACALEPSQPDTEPGGTKT